MNHPELQRDVTYLDLVSELKGEPKGFGEYARQLVEATGTGTIRDADRALSVLRHQDPVVFAWERPLSRQDRENRKAVYEGRIQEIQTTLNKGVFARTPEETGFRFWRWTVLVGALFMVPSLVPMGQAVLMIEPSKWWYSPLLSLPWAVGGWGLVLIAPMVGNAMEKRDRQRSPELRVYLKAAQELLEEETPAQVSPDQADRWLAFPEVARQARRWIRSSPGLMRRDVDLLDARMAELQAAKDAYRKGSLLRRLVGVRA